MNIISSSITTISTNHTTIISLFIHRVSSFWPPATSDNPATARQHRAPDYYLIANTSDAAISIACWK